MVIAVKHARQLRLEKAHRQSILDLGTGCGYFPYVCRHYGHDAVGVDVSVPMYREICSLLGLEWHEHRIEPKKRLPSFDRRFDLVTGLLVFFNHPRENQLWGVDEWRFFLKDLAEYHLSSNGSAYFKLVKNIHGNYYDQDLTQFFTDHGATLNAGAVHFPSLDAFRQG